MRGIRYEVEGVGVFHHAKGGYKNLAEALGEDKGYEYFMRQNELASPCEYNITVPEDARFFFTEYGVQRHHDLIELFLEYYSAIGLEVKIVTEDFGLDEVILVEDEAEQIIVPIEVYIKHRRLML